MKDKQTEKTEDHPKQIVEDANQSNGEEEHMTTEDEVVDFGGFKTPNDFKRQLGCG